MATSKMTLFCKRLFAWFAMAIAGALGGCASAPHIALPAPYTLSIQSSPGLNADANGRPSPLRIIVYELKATAAFESVDFFSLSQKDQAALGADAIGREEYFVRPGETKVVVRKGSPDAAYIGVFAEFRDIDKAVWRATTMIPATERRSMMATGMALLKSDVPIKTYHIILDQKSVRFQP